MGQTSIWGAVTGFINWATGGTDTSKGGTSTTSGRDNIFPTQQPDVVYKSNHQKRLEDDARARAIAAENRRQQQLQSSSGSGITDSNTAGEDSLSGGVGTGGSSDGSSSGSSSDGSSSGTSGATSPLLEGSMTFEELVAEICDGIDLIFICKRSTVVVTDYETLYAEAKYLRDNYHSSVQAEDIALWQLEDGSYELDVNEYGFYNTVIVKYKNGTVKESYEDLVRVYGEVPITYTEKTINKTTAIMKAKAYLAAHVRDFDMSVKASLLHDADIDIGDIVTLENPMTMRNQYRQDDEKRDPEYFFVMGNSISWEGDGYIQNDIELRYGAKSPEKKEVPETGASYSGVSEASANEIDGLVKQVAEKWSGTGYCNTCQTYSCVQEHNCGDCHGMSDTLSCELTAAGVTNKIVQYAAYTANHRSVMYKDATGNWVDFPYREYGFNKLFRNTSGSKTGTEVRSTCGGESID